jgi:ubiquinone/menaquinone biosynthesis C-methylase UbiE
MEGLNAENVLDVGSGTGIFAEAFSLRGLDVAGVDTNVELLNVARSRVPLAQFQEGSAEALPYRDDSFDLVFLGHLLHETDDPLAALKEARRVARGRVMVLEWPYRAEDQGPPLKHRLSPVVVAHLGRHAGFQSIESLTLDHMDLYRLTG